MNEISKKEISSRLRAASAPFEYGDLTDPLLEVFNEIERQIVEGARESSPARRRVGRVSVLRPTRDRIADSGARIANPVRIERDCNLTKSQNSLLVPLRRMRTAT